MSKVRKGNSLKVQMDDNISGIYKHIINYQNIP